MKAVVAILIAGFVGCGPRLRPIDPKEIENPELLVDTRELGPDFTVQQTVEATFRDRSAVFLAVIQKTGDKLVIVALTPQGQRAFVLEQRGTEVKFTQEPGVELPFSPWHILVDIHRALFRGGGPAPRLRADGTHSLTHPLEPMRETWTRGLLTRREISAHGAPAAVVIDYSPGPPLLYQRTVTYRNLRVGYTLTIRPR